VHAGDLIGGWAIDPLQLRIGFTRVFYPFFAGLLLYRGTKLTHIKDAFLWCSLLLVIFLSVPRLGGTQHLWVNGLYESLTIILVFPLIVYFGASGSVSGKWPTRICKFFGDISYPIYITHYPIIYIYTAWVFNHKLTIQQALPQAIIVLASSVALAYACLKFYDEPVRLWLKKRFLSRE
jgi:peptidoglycan/LPS O-acetylase OafA/YrhL